MFYVHEVTGTIVQRDSKPGWFWKGGYETEFQARSVSYDISKNSRDPFRAIYLFAKFFIFIAFILIVLLVKCIRMAFPKRGAKVSIATRIIGIVGSIIIISGYAIGGNYIYKYFFAPTGYVVTKCEILEYENKVSEPKDKEIGKIPDDVVLRLNAVSKTSNVVWLKVEKLVDDKPQPTWILIPEAINYQEKNKYLQYNKTSKTWDNYYALVDSKNNALLKECQNNFKEDVKNIQINHSSDMVLKESLKKTAFVLRESGYLGLWKSDGSDFYYIEKSDKKEFLEKFNTYNKQYENSKSKK